MNSPPERIVIIKPGALGDTLLLAPALRALREGLPGITVTVAGALPAVGLLKHFGLAEAVFDIERFNLYAPAENELRLLNNADVLAMMPLDAICCDALRERAGAGAIAVCPANCRPRGKHMAAFLHQCMKSFIPQTGALSRAAFVCPGDDAVKPVKPYAVLAPGAGSDNKRAPLRLFEAAACELLSKGVSPVFLAGEVEIAKGLAARYPRGFQRIDTPPLVKLAGLLQGAVAVYANDSGPAHLAGLLGVPTTVFFGATDPCVWQPWGPRVAIQHFEA